MAFFGFVPGAVAFLELVEFSAKDHGLKENQWATSTKAMVKTEENSADAHTGDWFILRDMADSGLEPSAPFEQVVNRHRLMAVQDVFVIHAQSQLANGRSSVAFYPRSRPPIPWPRRECRRMRVLP